ncbi:MAG TPA: chemotaxis protein CheA, partial [Polyangiales bacterium]|nr:chemotaxis protein CheA [Polyangiales bacterium]
MDEEARAEFLAESRENLDRVDGLLLELEKDPSAIAHVAPIFRAIHTIKGTCGFLGYPRLEAVTHAGEALLHRVREGELQLDRPIMSALFSLIDAVRAMLATIEAHGHDGEHDHARLIETLMALERGETVAVSTPAAALAGTGAEMSEDNFVRLDLRALDHLMNLVGELVLVRNQLVQVAAEHADAEVVSTSQRLSLITTELQSGVLKTRMQPIRNLWAKFPRMLRDLAVTCAKEVELETYGDTTELDRTVLEAIKDPLVHLLRNAVSHGIESPEARVASGKRRIGRVTMRAFHEGGRVHIEIADDGAGINLEKLRKRALAAGVIDARQAEHMDAQSSAALVFAPGLSTADAVTHVSGRGVGMDVVRTNLERAGGTIAIDTAPGRGTTFRLTIPLTLTIVPALIVSAAGDRYAIPESSLLEVLRLDDSQRAIETVNGAAVYRLRGRLLPIVYMDRELWQQGADGRSPERKSTLPSYIVVLQVGDRSFGLVVSRVHEVVEIVVKSLGSELADLPCFAGATILGDGQVALVVDVPSLARRAHVTHHEEHASSAHVSSKPAPDVQAQPAEQLTTLVLLAGASDERMAIPISEVARLEELPASCLERTGSRDEVMQYRGEIVPVLRLASLLAERRERPRTPSTPPPSAADVQTPDKAPTVHVVLCT